LEGTTNRRGGISNAPAYCAALASRSLVALWKAQQIGEAEYPTLLLTVPPWLLGPQNPPWSSLMRPHLWWPWTHVWQWLTSLVTPPKIVLPRILSWRHHTPLSLVVHCHNPPIHRF
jgi:hypothetical protein